MQFELIGLVVESNCLLVRLTHTTACCEICILRQNSYAVSIMPATTMSSV